MIYLCLGLAACCALIALSAVDAGAAADDNPVVVLDTTMGPITIELDKAKAPISVENFLKYVDSKFYDGLIFHRVMSDFMIQGGGMNEQMREKEAGAPIKNEASNGLTNKRGTIAMARTGDPNSATSEFFINVEDNTHKLGPGDVDQFGYAVFGKVIAGMDTVDAIRKVPTGRKGQRGDVPLKPVTIRSAKRKVKS